MKPAKLFLLLVISVAGYAQTSPVKGIVTHKGEPVPFANVVVEGTSTGTSTREDGTFTIALPPGKNTLVISAIGFKTLSKTITTSTALHLELTEAVGNLDAVVVTGTMKEVTKMNSPIPVEVYAPSFFLKNPTPNIFEALSVVNGVQPQINCNVCNTGDIHINGLEGPYTMILIDGMPIVSSLATVYGLSGIPNSLVKRMEIVKGPASTLYGSEAVGGVINIITKEPGAVPTLRVDAFGTSVGEYNLDVAAGLNTKNASTLLGINYFTYNQKRDINHDNFTDVTLQNRISVFNKWSFNRPSGKNFSMAARYVHENRWGGELQWTPAFRGSDEVYGESIYTNRAELLGNYQLNTSTPVYIDYSYNYHLQDSYYGLVKYDAKQQVAFAQLRLTKKLGQHELLAGIPLRYIYYDDNTPGTSSATSGNAPDIMFLPGVFVQDEVAVTQTFTTLAGMRYDRHNVHGNIFTPRLSFKYAPNINNTLRLTGGSGYRVVNLFTEDHAALTGSREVQIRNNLKPEQSWNANLNYAHNFIMKDGFINFDASLFYTYFTNKIVADFITDPTKIIYDNLDGHAISRGITVNADASFANSLKIICGATWMEVFQIKADETGAAKIPQLHAPRFSGTLTVSYTVPKPELTIDLTGRITGPMHLPVVENDFRPARSPAFALLNLQVTRSLGTLEVYAGVKNLLNFIPKNPLLHPDDPFNRPGGKYFDTNGNARPDTNPYGYTFDTAYNYAQMQGAKMQLGLRWTVN
ncbi:MAG: carboxypeptidase-like regulatory domain-containing protein [Cytophagales bacterium]|nr:carboxypeptidase-like regulatory domain-containing protein [Cytophagales bacterium]